MPTDMLTCHDCQTPVRGPAALARHRRQTGHRRYGWPIPDALEPARRRGR